MQTLPEMLRWGIFALAIISAITDLRNRTIPNWLTLPIIGAALIARWPLGGWSLLSNGLLGFGLGFGIYLIFFLMRGRGGGDVKLMGAYGALFGPMNWFVFFILTGILGGLVALVSVVARGRVKQTLENLKGIAGKDRATLDNNKSFAIPHGAVAAVPALLMAWAMGVV